MYVIHIDGDSFFVSCEILSRPHLRGLPVVTGGERGIATSMSKEAKALGVSRGMPSFMIRKQFPQVTILPSNFDLYRLIARRMYTIVRRHSDCVEEYSIDESFALIESYDSALKIKHDLESELGITFGIGVAPTKTLAKIASRYAKPNGIRFLDVQNNGLNNDLKNSLQNGSKKGSKNPSSIEPFILDYQKALSGMHIGGVWGIGRQTSAMLSGRGILTPLEFVKLDKFYVMSAFDKSLREKWLELSGEVVDEVRGESTHFITGYSKAHEQKSIGSSRTFENPTQNKEFLLNQLSRHVDDVCARARAIGLCARYCSFFLKRQDFSYIGSNFSLNTGSAIPGVFMKQIREQLDSLIESDKKKIPFRAVGCTLYDLVPDDNLQSDLFGNSDTNQKLKNVWAVADAINQKYGAYVNDPILKPASAKNYSENNSENKDKNLPNFIFPHLGFVR